MIGLTQPGFVSVVLNPKQETDAQLICPSNSIETRHGDQIGRVPVSRAGDRAFEPMAESITLKLILVVS